MTITLIDPCLNPEYTVPDPQVLTYTITDFDRSIILSPQASITPPSNVCKFESSIYIPPGSGIEDNVYFDKTGQTITVS